MICCSSWRALRRFPPSKISWQEMTTSLSYDSLSFTGAVVSGKIDFQVGNPDWDCSQANVRSTEISYRKTLNSYQPSSMFLCQQADWEFPNRAKSHDCHQVHTQVQFWSVQLKIHQDKAPLLFFFLAWEKYYPIWITFSKDLSTLCLSRSFWILKAILCRAPLVTF